MKRALLAPLLGAVVAILAAPGFASAEIVRDGKDASGPLDLVQVKLGQHERHLLVRVETHRPLPRLQALDPHPALAKRKPERYLCINLASHSIGRRLLCPAGKAHDGRLDVGVSAVSGGGTKASGSLHVVVEKSKRSLALDFDLGKLGLKPGKLTFSAQSSWYGPDCKSGRGKEGKQATCLDRAPQTDSGRSRIYPVRVVGCGGFSQSKVFNGSRSRKNVALTFDDGPGIYTPQVLRILADHHVHATFFEIGEQVPAYASTVRQILAQGNELGNHSLQHESGPGESSLQQTQSLIERASGFRPCMFRPPGGYLPSSTLAAAEALDLVSVIWDVDTEDYTLPGSGTIAQRATSVQPGSIVLMHDGGGNRSETVAALPAIIENLKSRGYHLMTMTKLLGGHYELAEVHGKLERPALPDLGPFPRHREGP